MGEITIRKAVSEDLEAILRLYQEPEFDDRDVLDLQAAQSIFTRMQSYPDFFVYVAENPAGEIVGTFELLIMDNLAHSGARSAILEDFCVRADQRGKGLGRQMVEFALEQGRLVGCYKLTLSSSVKRNGAHRFYETLGFNRYGVCFSVPLSTSDPS